jgi:hypothetical protein
MIGTSPTAVFAQPVDITGRVLGSSIYLPLGYL